MRALTVVLVAVLSAVAGAGYYYYTRHSPQAWEPPVPVRIEGGEGISALSPNWGYWMSEAEAGDVEGLLLRDGSYFFGGSDLGVRYAAADGRSLRVVFEKWRARAGDTTVTLDAREPEARDWLQKATEAQLAAIRTLVIPDNADVDDTTLAAFKRLAARNPHVDFVGDNGASVRRMLELFQPRAVMAGGGPNADLSGAISHQSQIDTVLVDASEPGSLAFLGTLPSLRHLLLAKWDVARAGPLPADLPISSLMVMEVSGDKPLRSVEDLALPAGLQELSLLGIKGLTDITGLASLTQLQTLLLSGADDLTEMTALNGLPQLRWLGLPPKTTQAQFAAIVSAHPKLSILDLAGTDQITSLDPLRGATELHGLILGNSTKDLTALRAMTSLRFVGIPKEVWDAAPEQAVALRKALPDALIVRVKPFCLGSGWILLLVPVFALMRRRQHGAAHAA